MYKRFGFEFKFPLRSFMYKKKKKKIEVLEWTLKRTRALITVN